MIYRIVKCKTLHNNYYIQILIQGIEHVNMVSPHKDKDYVDYLTLKQFIEILK